MVIERGRVRECGAFWSRLESSEPVDEYKVFPSLLHSCILVVGIAKPQKHHQLLLRVTDSRVIRISDTSCISLQKKQHKSCHQSRERQAHRRLPLPLPLPLLPLPTRRR